MEQLKEQANKRIASLKDEYSGWIGSHKDLSKYINQTRGRFDGERRRGEMIDHKTILDGYAKYAQTVLASGLQNGMTNPLRPWVRFVIDGLDEETNNIARGWLDQVGDVIHKILSKSNFYSVFYGAYEELGQFGTACYAGLGDFEDVMRGRSFTAGEYWIGTDHKGRVNKFGREYWFQVSQLVNEFGLESVSKTVQNDWNNNKKDGWVKCRHLIEPNDSRVEGMEDFTGKKYRSLYWEVSDGGEGFLAKRGYDRFPIIAPRWDTVTTDNSYGYGAGWFALGDGKQLQKTNLDKLLAQEKEHNPPMQKDANVEGFVNNVPGGVTVNSSSLPNTGLRPAYQIKPDLNSFIEMENSLKDRINKFFFVDFFLMLNNLNNSQKTATEIAAREGEKLMMMGHLLHKVQEEMLDPTIELIYGEAMDTGMLPPPPEEIEGLEIKVQYISVLAQAQRAMGVQQIEKVVGFVAETSAVNPEIVDVINWDEAARSVSELEGAPSKIINSPEFVRQMREQKAQQAQMAQMAEMAASAAGTAKTMSDTEMDKNSALDGALDR